MSTRLRALTAVCAIGAVLLLGFGDRLAADAKRYRACVFMDKTRPQESVLVDDLRNNEAVYDTGGLDYFWVFGPSGAFQMYFNVIRQIEVLQWLGKDPSRADYIRYSVKVTGSASDQPVYGTLDIRTLRGLAGPTPWYYAPAWSQDRGSKFWRIVFDTPCAGPTIPPAPPVTDRPPNVLMVMGRPVEVLEPPAGLAEPPAAPAAPAAVPGGPNVEELGDVFYEYDKWALSDAGKAVLAKNAAWMQRWPNTRLLIEGQADVRGTNEYNFPLGQRRAEAARDYLVTLGIAPDRLVTATMGKTNLVCTSLDETCWQRNRRAHFSLVAK